ncbi:type III secretion system cytoplasmic ring protein SctQ [Rhizobium leguminosarum]|uniref:type III secretion system cytoplasmic ring protein SctQ n=1 Tax=Rhizobium leguminosarum TaxID=384 RepID=UPI0013BE38B7|nr:type III secretion system cytoplasmic ring protein SctQ [Rhizobium leguminosarum]NEI67599.1 YscQ/HrcQ family type III secretion apparatus protein [Rhizobium leguminosarum]
MKKAHPLAVARSCRFVEPPPVTFGGRHATLKPALILSRGVVSWLNGIATPRTAFRSQLGDMPLSIRMERIVWQREPSPAPMFDCIWRAGEETIVLSLCRRLAEALISTVQNGLALPCEPTGSLVLELALEPLIARLESQIQRNVQFLRTGDATTPAPYLEFDIACGPVSGKVRLFLFSPLDGRVPSAFRALGELLGQLQRQPCDLFSKLPITVAAEIGSLSASVALLRNARAGDALLPEVLPFGRGQIILSAGRLWTAADIAGDRLILRHPFCSRPCRLENAHMTKKPEPQQAPAEADLDDVEITLVFECGRWSMPLGELRSAGEGHVFELGRPIDGPIDILANGQRIGRGDIVGIGDGLGIRLRGRLACND